MSALSILSLPNELLLWVAASLEHQRDINAFSQANRLLYDLVDPYLYRSNVRHCGSSGLLSAAEQGNEEAARKLIDYGANLLVKSKRRDLENPLSVHTDYEHCEEYLSSGPLAIFGDIDERERPFGWTPLFYAACNGHVGVVKILLEANGGYADVMVDRKRHWQLESWTPLASAARRGHAEVVRLLLADKRIDPNPEDWRFTTPLYYAVRCGHEEVVRVMLACDKVEPDARVGVNPVTPLFAAASRNHANIMKMLLATGDVDPGATDGTGLTALHYAARNGHEAAVRVLLEDSRVNADKGDKNRGTPLMYAARWGHENIVRVLLKTGRVDVNAQGRRARQWAMETNQIEVVRLLDQASRASSS